MGVRPASSIVTRRPSTDQAARKPTAPRIVRLGRLQSHSPCEPSVESARQLRAKGCARVYGRLAVDWADSSGGVHGAGEFVDIDVVTLAELEERGVVENADEINRPAWVGPGK